MSAFGTLMYRTIERLPEGVLERVQARAARSGRLSSSLRRVTRFARSGVLVIREGPAAGLKIDLANSRPSYVLGTAEPEVQRFIVEHLRRGGVFYDVGANVGYFSLVASRLVGAGGAVRAYEPLPRNAEAIRRATRLNGLTHLEVIEAAVSNATGSERFVEGPTGQDGRLGEGDVTVQTLTIDDDVARGARPPSMIKMDVEGAELVALQGAHDTLLRHRPVVLVEVHSTSPSLETHPVPQLMRELGYEVSWLEDLADADNFWAPHLVALPSSNAQAGAG